VFPQGSNSYQINLSGLGCWITAIAIAWLLGSLGLGWIVKSVFVLLALLLIAPIVGFLGFRWWLSRNLIEAACPVCQTPLAGINQTQMTCPACRTPLKVKRDGFERFTPSGTVEVAAVEVNNDSGDEDEAVEVTVEVLPPVDREGL
jgi:hypothetical protein